MSEEKQEEEKALELEGIRTANDKLKTSDPVGLDIDIIKHSPVRACEAARPVLPDQSQARQTWKESRQAAIRTSFFFLIASLVLYFMLMMNHMEIKVSNPVDNILLDELKLDVGKNLKIIEDSEDKYVKEDLRAENEVLIQQIRQLDYDLRVKYFGLLDQKDPGFYILFCCLIGFFLSLRAIWKYSGDPPLPLPDFEKGQEQAREKRLGMKAVLIVLSMMVAGSLYIISQDLQRPGEAWNSLFAKETEANVIDDAVVFEGAMFNANWPWFRGTTQTTALNEFETFSFGDNAEATIKWKVQMPMTGISSPIIWDRRIFITGANGGKRSLYCYNADTGKLSWSYGVKSLSKKGKPEAFEDYMYAAITPATDGHRVYALFANGDMVATDLKGKTVWEKDLGMPENAYGAASSLLTWQNKVIVPWEHEGKTSAIYCFDGKTGKELWKIDRHEYTANWRTPIIIRDQGKDLLVVSHEKIIAYDLENGKEIWHFSGVDEEIGTSPTYHEGILYTLGDDGAMLAVKMGGTGDIMKSNLLWLNDETALPDMPSPVTNGKRLWSLGSGGDLVCYDAKTGKAIYEVELEMPVYASPMLLGDRILIFGQKGRCITIDTSDTFKITSDVNYKLPINASAAPYGKRLIIRAAKELFCIEGGS